MPTAACQADQLIWRRRDSKMWMGFEVIKAHPTWRGGRVVDGSGLENQRCESIRGFESHPLRF